MGTLAYPTYTSHSRWKSLLAMANKAHSILAWEMAQWPGPKRHWTWILQIGHGTRIRRWLLPCVAGRSNIRFSSRTTWWYQMEIRCRCVSFQFYIPDQHWDKWMFLSFLWLGQIRNALCASQTVTRKGPPPPGKLPLSDGCLSRLFGYLMYDWDAIALALAIREIVYILRKQVKRFCYNMCLKMLTALEHLTF